MSGGMPLLLLHAFMLWTGTTLHLRELLARRPSFVIQENWTFSNAAVTTLELSSSAFAVYVSVVFWTCWGNRKGRRQLGRPRRRWADNIRMDLQEVGCGYMDWIGLAQDRDRWRTLVSAVMNLRVPWNAGNFLTSCKPVSFSRRTLHHGVIK